MSSLLLALAVALPQEGEVDRLLAGHEQRMRAARNAGEQRRVIAETREKLDAFAAAQPAHPDVPRARWHAAESYLALDNVAGALDRLRALVREHPDAAPTSNARLALGQIFLQQEKWGEAKEAFAEFLRRHPKDERAFYAKALAAAALQGEGDYDRAVERLAAARAEHKERPESWGALLQIAVARHAQGKHDEARRVLDDVIQTCPDRETQDVARLHLSAYLKLGTPRPPLAGKDLQGKELAADALSGRVSIVYFFDATLAPAVEEARFLAKLRGERKELAVVGVSVDLERKELLHFADELKPDWPLLFEGKGYDGAAAKAYDVRRLPSLWVCDRKGALRYHNLAGADLRRAVERLLQEK